MIEKKWKKKKEKKKRRKLKRKKEKKKVASDIKEGTKYETVIKSDNKLKRRV